MEIRRWGVCPRIERRVVRSTAVLQTGECRPGRSAGGSHFVLPYAYLSLPSGEVGFVVDSYEDLAVGFMETDSRGRKSVTSVTLAPTITFSGLVRPSDPIVERLHHEAHEECYVANSERSENTVGGTWQYLTNSA